jgi:putative membrane protein insertion efficiency factor
MTHVRRISGWLRMGFTFLLVAPIRFYQLIISPVTPATCRFHPTCSAYAVVALRRHGPLKGLTLAIYRIGRCHPWQPGGLDPVPSKGNWRPDMTADGRTVIPSRDLRAQTQTTSQPTRLAA